MGRVKDHVAHLVVDIFDFGPWFEDLFWGWGLTQARHQDGEDGFDLGRVGRLDGRGVLRGEHGPGVDLESIE
jgi:hypothetical protein